MMFLLPHLPSPIDSTIADLYSVISGPAGQKRDWDRFRALFEPDAKMFVVYAAKSGSLKILTIGVEEYIRESAPPMSQKGFFEHEVSRRSEVFGGIAQVFSTYESRFRPEDKPFERGINSISLVLDGDKWKIAAISWQGEDAKHPLPPRYLSD